MTDIHREETESKGRYWTNVQGHTAELTYSRLGKTQIIVDHPDVPDALRGTGVGARLVERAVLDARTEGIRIVPLCPFTRAQIARHPEWQDVL